MSGQMIVLLAIIAVGTAPLSEAGADAEKRLAARDAECVATNKEVLPERYALSRHTERRAKLWLLISLSGSVNEPELTDCIRSYADFRVDVERAFPGVTESVLADAGLKPDDYRYSLIRPCQRHRRRGQK